MTRLSFSERNPADHTPGDFTPQASAYARSRPSYPAALVGLLTEIVGIGKGAAVAEIGAGTGLFTSCLAGRGWRVTAVEPNPEMRRRARRFDDVEWRDGTFEDTGLADASQAWVAAAHAFHWAEPDAALPELRRVLLPGGHLSVLWNVRDLDASPVLRATWDLVEARVPGFDEGYRDADWPAILVSSGDFQAPFELALPHAVSMSAERYLDLWRSHHLLTAALGEDGMADFLAEVEALLDGKGELAVPYVCRVFTARASPSG